jgi:4-hydroxy-tetrahydrodipicolinate synthase
MSSSSAPEPYGFLSGVITPFFTPFQPDRSIDYGAVKGMVDHLVRTKSVRTVFARSGLGQIFTFTFDETKRFADAIRDAVGDGMGAMIGCPGEWLNRTAGQRPDPDRYVAQGIELTLYAQKIGIDAAVHPLPVAIQAKDGEPVSDVVYRYYKAIHDATAIPIVIYQQPGTPGDYCLTPDLLKKMIANLPRVIGTKVSSADDDVMLPLLAAAKGTPFRMICGHEGYFFNGLQHGAVGVIGQGAMGFPEALHAVETRFYAGDMAGAKEAMDAVWKALKITDGMSCTVAYKQYLNRKGVKCYPYERGASEPYNVGTSDPYPDDVMDRVEREIDAVRAKYRVA